MRGLLLFIVRVFILYPLNAIAFTLLSLAASYSLVSNCTDFISVIESSIGVFLIGEIDDWFTPILKWFIDKEKVKCEEIA